MFTSLVAAIGWSFDYNLLVQLVLIITKIYKLETSWSWSHGSWTYNQAHWEGGQPGPRPGAHEL